MKIGGRIMEFKDYLKIAALYLFAFFLFYPIIGNYLLFVTRHSPIYLFWSLLFSFISMIVMIAAIVLSYNALSKWLLMRHLREVISEEEKSDS
jgi:hypothetical protein